MIPAVAGKLTGMAFAAGRRTVRKPSAPVVVANAFENETGVQAPVGFWDPAGFTSNGNAYEFRRRRVVELKHGRVSMLACMGYIVPEYFKFPGYLAPSIGLKFADVPNGLAALSKVPGVGWFQYVLFCGLCDLFLLHQEPFEEPGKLRTHLFGGDFSNYEYGAYGLPDYLGGKSIADAELRKKKLNAELANGRLAMTAIIAMFFQNGTVGTTGPEMWLPSSAFETELGVQAPVGFWDPLGFTKGVDAGESGAAPKGVKKSVADLSDADLDGKTVLIRCDLSVPLNGDLVIPDETRITSSIPTIEYLCKKGAKVLACSHLGRPKNGPEDKFSLEPVAKLSVVNFKGSRAAKRQQGGPIGGPPRPN